jgi:hypothetical protein
MTENPLDPRVAALLDKQEIREVVLRYCRGIDRMDQDLVRSCYHPDATDEHGSFFGGVDEYVAFAWKLMPRYDATMHFVGNVLIELEGDAARSEAYCIAHHRSASGVPAHNLATGCRYIDTFERREDRVWRIAKRVVTTEWIRHDIPEVQFPIKDTLRTGQRNRSDAVYEPIS